MEQGVHIMNHKKNILTLFKHIHWYFFLVISFMLLFCSFAFSIDCSTSNSDKTSYRQVHFLTNEGTQMSSDTFPDCQKLVFDLLGNLYILPFEGGKAKALTQDIHYNFWPAVSPDGRWIAFVSDRNGTQDIWLINSKNGKCVQIMNTIEQEQSPAWLDAERLLFVQNSLGKGKIGIYHLSNGKTKWIECEGNKVISVSKGPDDTILTCEITKKHAKIIQRNLSNNEDNSKGKHLINNEFDQINPAISPNGAWLAYGAYHRGRAYLMITPFKGGEEIIISPYESEYYLYGADIGGPRFHFTPDGKALVYYYRGQLHYYSLASGKVKPLPMTAEVNMQIPVFPRLIKHVESCRLPEYAKGITAWAITPDLSKAYAFALGKLWLIETDKATPSSINIDLPDIELFSLSPNAHYFAFTATERAGKEWEGLWVADLRPKTSPPGRVLSKTVQTLSWEPDNQFLLTVEREKDKVKILRISTDNWKIAETIEVQEKVVSNPQRLANGKLYITIANKKGVSQVAEVSEKSEVSICTAFRRNVVYPTIAPDGSRVLFSTEEGVFWLPFPHKDGSRDAWNKVAEPPCYFSSWEKAGQAIAYYGDNEVVITSIEGKALKSFSLNIPVEKPNPAPALKLKGGFIVPLEQETILKTCDITTEDHRIKEIMPSSSEAQANINSLDLSGKYLIPGLMDTHVHCASQNLHPYLAYGVTTIRDAGGTLLRLQQLRELIESEKIAGPRLFYCGTAFYGPSAFYGYYGSISSIGIHNEEEATAKVKRLNRGGADYIKLYAGLSRSPKWATTRTAAAVGLNTIGHSERMPVIVSHFLEGVGTIEHGLDSRIYHDFIQLILQLGTFYDSTMMAIGGQQWYLARHPEVLQDPHFLSLASETVMQGYKRRAARDNNTMDALESRIREQAEPLYYLASTRQVVAGTDAMVAFPGIGLHWEMEAMVIGGMTPQQALRAATIDAAYCMGIDKDLGSIAENKLADIIVLNKNPLFDITATKDIALIIKNGLCYSPETGKLISVEEAKNLLENKEIQREKGE